MTNFRVKMELQGFKLDIEGERADIPAIEAIVSKQIAGMLGPAAREGAVEARIYRDCLGGEDDSEPCASPATETRTVNGVDVPLCAEHAQEFDAEEGAES